MRKTENRGAKVRHAAGSLSKSVLVLIFMAIVFLGCMYKVQSLKSDADALDEEIASLEEQIEDEKEQQIEDQVLSKYYESDAYKEQLARDRLNLIYSGDRLYILE